MEGGKAWARSASSASFAMRVLLIILDGLGVGELPDAEKYGDRGSATLPNLARARGGVRLPHLGSLGLGNIVPVAGVPPAASPRGAYGRMAERSPGKDSTTGHWELAGLVTKVPFPTYPNGFPPDVMEPFERAIGRGTLGNVAASGTEIIERLGEEHVRTGKPIVYTSADSVFQIAAHEDVIPIEKLYEFCRIARSILTGDHAVGRVIARPFAGKSGAYYRTPRRHDFSIEPLGETVLDRLTAAGITVFSVGKVRDLFAGRGIAESVPTESNAEGVEAILGAMKSVRRGLIFANLVDFDMLWGHRNDVEGFARGLEEFDERFEEILGRAERDDLVMVTADHGNDPTTPSTDHSREYVPLLVTGRRVRGGVDLGVRESFADVGATLAELFGVPAPTGGRSFLREL
jgi:phosphopentomutase